MKSLQPTLLALLLVLGTFHSHATITIPGADGSDGALNITVDTVIDLSQAVTGAWNADNTANAGKGVYDPAKWAIVFKYTSVTVAAGKTLSFKNHASRAPVVWLVSGNATITGIVSLNGASGGTGVSLAEPGPGGSRGGQSIFSTGVGSASGFGVGGGNQSIGGSYGSQAASGSLAYGNPSLIPLIGGSGGGGSFHGDTPGGAGGGAILIACAETLSVTGEIRSNGGNGRGSPSYPYPTGGGGSGGGVRLIADTVAGTGAVRTLAGANGGLGRIRIERVNNTNSFTVTPDPSIVPLSPSDIALLWPPAGSPEVKIVSIGSQDVPADPRAEFGTIGADAVLPQVASTQVLIETTNVEQASQVKVRGTPRSNAHFTEVNATVSSVVSTTPLVVRWTATLPVQVGYAAVQVKVIRP